MERSSEPGERAVAIRRRWAVAALLAFWISVLVVLSPLALSSASPAPPGPGSTAGSDAAGGQATRDGVVSIAWAGDITLGSRYGLPPDQGRALFAHMRPHVAAADLSIGNLEGTLGVGGASKCGTDGGDCFSFQAPPENAAALRWAGFDLVNLANNHSIDFGASGAEQTRAALEDRGLRHTGLPGQVEIVKRRGLRIAVIGFAPYEWAADLRDPAQVKSLVGLARRRADLVVVLAHIGAEGSAQTTLPGGQEFHMGEDRGDTRGFAHAAVDAGADLVLGSGPHVLRGVEIYRGKLIAYSLGNFAGWHNFSTSGQYRLSGLLNVRLSPGGHLRGGALVPTVLDPAGVPALDPAGEATRLVNELGSSDFETGGVRLLPDGSF